MKNTQQIAVVAGVPIVLHSSFVYFFSAIYLSICYKDGLQDSLIFLSQLVLIFSLLCVHEFAHILTALRYGVKTKQVLILPVGGAACMDTMPDKPLHEFLMSLAGPLSNVCLALISYPIYLLIGPDVPYVSKGIEFFTKINVLLAVFNLLPIFPMDGGRILRSGIQMVSGIKRHLATNVAYYAGIGVLAIVIAFGISEGQYMMVVVLGIVALGGYAEMYMTREEYKKVEDKQIVEEYLDEYDHHVVKSCHMVEFLKKISTDKKLSERAKCAFLFGVVYGQEKIPCATFASPKECICGHYPVALDYAVNYYEKAGQLGQVSPSMEDVFVADKKRNGIPLPYSMA